MFLRNDELSEARKLFQSHRPFFIIKASIGISLTKDMRTTTKNMHIIFAFYNQQMVIKSKYGIFVFFYLCNI